MITTKIVTRRKLVADDVSPQDLIRAMYERFGKRLVLTSSFGIQAAVMLHMAVEIIPDITVIVVDTGYFFPETYEYMECLRKLLNLQLAIFKSPISPKAMEVQYGKLWAKGPMGIDRYNQIRKVWPMERAYHELGVKACLAGLRSSQTKFRKGLTRTRMRGTGVLDVYPILHWTKRDVANYFKVYNLPRHPLEARGYSSVGDWHSTLPSKSRSGRFCGMRQECRLHTT